MGWRSESQEEGEPAPGEEVGLRASQSGGRPESSALSLGRGTTRVKLWPSPLHYVTWGGCGLANATQPTVDVFFVSIITPSHTHACTQAHTHTCTSHCGVTNTSGALAPVKWKKRDHSGVKISLSPPARLFSDIHRHMPARPWQVPMNIKATWKYECWDGHWVTKLWWRCPLFYRFCLYFTQVCCAQLAQWETAWKKEVQAE